MENKISKNDIADKAGMSRGLYCDITNGKREITKDAARKLAPLAGMIGDEWVRLFVLDSSKIHSTIIENMKGRA